MTELTWCAGCYVEFTVSRDDEGDLVVVFDDKKRTLRFAFAKALAKAGGARIGSDSGN